MNWKSRLKLFTGLVMVLAVLSVLILIFNQRQTQAASTSAQVRADSFNIATDYSGTVMHQYTRVGADVVRGQQLFTIQSVRLKEDLFNGLEVPNTKAYTVDKTTGSITYRAVVSGQVSSLPQLGDSTKSGTPAATITSVSTPYVLASYTMSPTDYGRVLPGAQVSLLMPDNQTLLGQVATVRVTTTPTGQAQAVVKVGSTALSSAPENLRQSGTPVLATLRLRDDGPLAGVSDRMDGFLRQIGLR